MSSTKIQKSTGESSVKMGKSSLLFAKGNSYFRRKFSDNLKFKMKVRYLEFWRKEMSGEKNRVSCRRIYSKVYDAFHSGWLQPILLEIGQCFVENERRSETLWNIQIVYNTVKKRVRGGGGIPKNLEEAGRYLSTNKVRSIRTKRLICTVFSPEGRFQLEKVSQTFEGRKSCYGILYL